MPTDTDTPITCTNLPTFFTLLSPSTSLEARTSWTNNLASAFIPILSHAIEQSLTDFTIQIDPLGTLHNVPSVLTSTPHHTQTWSLFGGSLTASASLAGTSDKFDFISAFNNGLEQNLAMCHMGVVPVEIDNGKHHGPGLLDPIPQSLPAPVLDGLPALNVGGIGRICRVKEHRGKQILHMEEGGAKEPVASLTYGDGWTVQFHNLPTLVDMGIRAGIFT
ncbi:hypothetical protein HDV00_008458 [Rhizophlyctis rosea]|nr:hypothetical protein HDV00_008458 [Rhizophlyctis rosea]